MPGRSNPFSRLAPIVALLALGLCGVPRPVTADPTEFCGAFDIDRVGLARVEAIKQASGVEWWIELDDRLVACGAATAIGAIAAGHPMVEGHEAVDRARLLISRGSSRPDLETAGFRVIASSAGYAVIESSPSVRERVIVESGNRRHRKTLAPLTHDTVVLRQEANAPPRAKGWMESDSQALVDQVNGNRWFDDVVTLTSYNRYTHSPDVLNARDWLVSEFQSIPNLTVETQSFSVSGTTAYNVVATLEGSLGAQDWVVIGGHYDSTSQNPTVAAPGAEDNASGCAGVVEMARIFATSEPRSTVLFVCYSGEEQGLIGSEAHVSALQASGDLGKVNAMLNMDMIGYTSDSDLDCLLETESFAQSLLDEFIDAAIDYTQLRIVTSLFAWGSDHVPFLDAGVPALLTIENDWSEYPDYHRTTDLPANLTIAMAEEILKMNVGAAAVIIGSEPGGVFTDDFESGGLTAWSAHTP